MSTPTTGRRREPLNVSDLRLGALLASSEVFVEVVEEIQNGPFSRSSSHRLSGSHFSMPDLSLSHTHIQTQQSSSCSGQENSCGLRDSPAKSSTPISQPGPPKMLSVHFDPSLGHPESDGDSRRAQRSRRSRRHRHDDSSSSDGCDDPTTSASSSRITVHSQPKSHRTRRSKDDSGPRNPSDHSHGSQRSERPHCSRSSRPVVERPLDDDDCSSCSSSSSDDFPYELPQRRAYGGVRISYVSSDALAVAKQRTRTNSAEKKNPDKNCIIS